MQRPKQGWTAGLPEFEASGSIGRFFIALFDH
jgi:hypothetical protein